MLRTDFDVDLDYFPAVVSVKLKLKDISLIEENVSSEELQTFVVYVLFCSLCHWTLDIWSLCATVLNLLLLLNFYGNMIEQDRGTCYLDIFILC